MILNASFQHLSTKNIFPSRFFATNPQIERFPELASRSLLKQDVLMTDGKKSSSSNGDSLENDTGFILVEIVSALNVPNVDHRKEPDPFVVVEMAGRPVHQTDVLYNTHFPIWSLECGSLFLLETAKDKYVQFILKEYESWRQDPTLGTLELSLEEMKQGKGNRREFPLIVPQHVLDLTQSVKATIVRKVSCQQIHHPTSINFLCCLPQNFY